MCGHFQIPFLTFFIPTIIGKAVNKVTIQVIFIVVAFSKHIMSSVLKFMAYFAPKMSASLGEAIELQKKTLFKTQAELDEKEANEPFIKTLWEWFITAMILYFLITFFNALVRN